MNENNQSKTEGTPHVGSSAVLADGQASMVATLEGDIGKLVRDRNDLRDAMSEKPDNYISKRALKYRLAQVKTLKWLGWATPGEVIELKQALRDAQRESANDQAHAQPPVSEQQK